MSKFYCAHKFVRNEVFSLLLPHLTKIKMPFFDKKLWNQYNFLIVPYYPNNITRVLSCFTIPKEKAKNEKIATQAIRAKLSAEGFSVMPKDKRILYNDKNFGTWQFFIDIEAKMNDGVAVGIEVKLAKRLLKERREIYRMIGQTFLYRMVNYKTIFSIGIMMVIIIGEETIKESPEMKFIFKGLKKLSIHPLYIPINKS